MMKIQIKKNRHYPFPPKPTILPVFVKRFDDTIMKHSFLFTKTCLFDLIDNDQHDVNKLFGFSIGLHHTTSFRFGWRPILKNNTIQIVACEYHEKIRQKTIIITELDIDKWYDFELRYSPVLGITTYYCDNHTVTNEFNLKKDFGWGYSLCTYFGGNEKAPQNIIIYMK